MTHLMDSPVYPNVAIAQDINDYLGTLIGVENMIPGDFQGAYTQKLAGAITRCD